MQPPRLLSFSRLLQSPSTRATRFCGCPSRPGLLGALQPTSPTVGSAPLGWSTVPVRFAGHNKWSQIKRAKAVNDGKRGATFTRLALTITAAVKAAVLNDAKKVNMPKATVEKAIKRGTGETDEKLTHEVYQGYGPHQVAFMITHVFRILLLLPCPHFPPGCSETMTDNPTRTVQRVRSILTRAGGSITSVEWLFQKKGLIHFDRGTRTDSDDTVLENAIDAGAEDIEELGGGAYKVICGYQDLQKTYRQLTGTHGYHVTTAELTYIPDSHVDLNEEQLPDLEHTFDRLEDVDEVTKVHCNAA
ncbi:hypothetical protein IWQ60_011656 [Tieghemiomyces parasiticus]|uniref:YebC-like protein n=1 Tax=Tieghemiomyces parasiticus TaxID=78921 RepID=A0A9W8DH35_9FUNG|nr:hypothetical protein IWQ60_011656 [Tieghemiomyces parasiticus]